MEFTKLPIPIDDRTPEGYKLIVAYAKDDDIVIPVDPIDEEKDEHDCDWEGCSSLSHVVRFNSKFKYANDAKISQFERSLADIESFCQSRMELDTPMRGAFRDVLFLVRQHKNLNGLSSST